MLFIPGHCAGVHEAKAKGVRELPAHSVGGPILGFEVPLRSRGSHRDVLDIPPVQLRVGLEREGDDAGGHRTGCARSGVLVGYFD